MKNKKGVELTFNTIAVATLVIVVLFVLIISFTNLFGKQRNLIGDKIDDLEKEVEEERSDIVIPLSISFSILFGYILHLITLNPSIKKLNQYNEQ